MQYRNYKVWGHVVYKLKSWNPDPVLLWSAMNGNDLSPHFSLL